MQDRRQYVYSSTQCRSLYVMYEEFMGGGHLIWSSTHPSAYLRRSWLKMIRTTSSRTMIELCAIAVSSNRLPTRTHFQRDIIEMDVNFILCHVGSIFTVSSVNCHILKLSLRCKQTFRDECLFCLHTHAGAVYSTQFV